MGIARYEKRVLGWLIDRLLSLFVGAGLFYPFRLLFGPSFSLYFLVIFCVLGAYFFYFLSVFSFLWISDGRTLGGLLFGVRTFRPDGNRLSFSDAFLKALLTGVVTMALVNALFMLFIHTERSAFDRLTNTIVIDTRAS